jgi:hypothetical protein
VELAIFQNAIENDTDIGIFENEYMPVRNVISTELT